MTRGAALSVDGESATAGLILRDCPHCASTGFQKSETYSKDVWSVGQCVDCDFVYLKNVPDYSRMIDEFAWEKTFSVETDRRKKERPLTKRFGRFLRRAIIPFKKTESALFAQLFQSGRVLSVGCGAGEAMPGTLTPFGIELSRELHAIANQWMRNAGGYCVHAPAVEGIDQFDDNFFTGIVLRSFLEHEWQPKKLLKNAHRVLREDGGIFVRVPNFASYNRKFYGSKWCGLRYPDHVNYFTPESLQIMAVDCGFNMRILNPLNLAFDDNIKAVLTKKPDSNGALH